MEKIYIIAANLCILLTLVGCTTTTDTTAKECHEGELVVRLKGGIERPDDLARRYGFRNQRSVLGMNDTFIWQKDCKKINKRSTDRFVEDLTSNSEIIWADWQRKLQRSKRDLLDIPESGKSLIRRKRMPDDKKYKPMFNDPEWNDVWLESRTWRKNKQLKLNISVLPLYRLGITGRGINVVVLDDGIEYTHEDLRNNYNPDISYDINDNDNDPTPDYRGVETYHGTRCAGEIAMEADNGKCGVGVAFEASIGGIRMLDGHITDTVEGEALGYKQHLVDIYTAAWGPFDDGMQVEGPDRLAAEALERGVTQGRNGKGNIYVWASGNGGGVKDHCSCDGYVGSIYTIAISSASPNEGWFWFSEECPAVLAATYSSNTKWSRSIATTDLHNECTADLKGTSASAPIAAGIIALALQVNNELTWRDVQHLIVQTSESTPLRKHGGWVKNSVGLWFNTHAGFGLMNPYALVSAAYNWTRVPEKNICFIRYEGRSPDVSDGEMVSLVFDVDECPQKDQEVMFLEHVQVELSIRHSRRGSLQIFLTSPSGTPMALLNHRPNDKSSEGFSNWKFMSVATWGENPQGKWRLDIFDALGDPWYKEPITNATLILHGTKQPPKSIDKTFRINKDHYYRVKEMDRKVVKTEVKNSEPDYFEIYYDSEDQD